MKKLIEIHNSEKADLSEILMCPHCGGYMQLDNTYLEQVEPVVCCPYCKEMVGVNS